MSILVTGTPGSGKTSLVKYAVSKKDVRFFDADEIPELCEWREFKTGKVMGLVTKFVENGKDDWYAKYGWYWRVEQLKKFLTENPEAIVCGSSENIVECYNYFDKVIFIKVTETELLSNLSNPIRNNPFGKTPKQRANFMNWQDYLINQGADNKKIITGNDTSDAYQIVISVV